MLYQAFILAIILFSKQQMVHVSFIFKLTILCFIYRQSKLNLFPGYRWEECEFSPLSCLLRRRK
ncbi:unnamed protein product [Thelazia callipaeda]|uniref:Secreted protein n=1 Tax=Thelazia callipaeda TaxID=103827 RepID=A0A0N5D4Z5_THECL|nr:unnamed protein product [Thelazia callipaeda]